MLVDLKPVYWEDGKVKLIDQTRIPDELSFLELGDYADVVRAIACMQVRGAPAIGVAAALGIALAAKSLPDEGFISRLEEIATEFASTRPTAANLFWAIDRMMAVARQKPVEEVREALLTQALEILREDVEINRTLGQMGAVLINDGDTVMTHCNAGALATAGYGTAVGVIRAAHESGKRVQVIANETRPRLQGMKLTAWELARYGIPVTCITDSMAAWVMKQGKVDRVIVGADRIAANGDFANKVGTYGVAVLAKAHDIPFYVAAPVSTVDFAIPDGGHIPIEERCPEEVTHIGECRICPDGVGVLNPAFDVTPAEYVTAIITERGILRPPFTEALDSLFLKGGQS